MTIGSTEQEPVRSDEQSSDPGRNDREADIAWAAGFFDGEGHIAIHRTRNTSSFNLTLGVAQVDPRPLVEFQRILGGKIYPHHNHTRHTPECATHRPAVQWAEWGAKAGDILKTIRPYLRHKAEQADIAIGFQEVKVVHRGIVASPEEFDRGAVAAQTLKDIRASFGRY